MCSELYTGVQEEFSLQKVFVTLLPVTRLVSRYYQKQYHSVSITWVEHISIRSVQGILPKAYKEFNPKAKLIAHPRHPIER